MFFLVAGALEVLEGTSVVANMRAGQSFGEVCIGNPDGGKRTATVRAQSDGVELLTLNTEAFSIALHAVGETFVSDNSFVDALVGWIRTNVGESQAAAVYVVWRDSSQVE